ncbi:hypothetical protein CR513_56326, partial [Mucuna pruriens]
MVKLAVEKNLKNDIHEASPSLAKRIPIFWVSVEGSLSKGKLSSSDLSFLEYGFDLTLKELTCKLLDHLDFVRFMTNVGLEEAGLCSLQDRWMGKPHKRLKSLQASNRGTLPPTLPPTSSTYKMLAIATSYKDVFFAPNIQLLSFILLRFVRSSGLKYQTKDVNENWKLLKCHS